MLQLPTPASPHIHVGCMQHSIAYVLTGSLLYMNHEHTLQQYDVKIAAHDDAISSRMQYVLRCALEPHLESMAGVYHLMTNTILTHLN